MTNMMAIRVRRKRSPLFEPNSITQLLKAIRKGHVAVPPVHRMATARHRRGERGHESTVGAP